jgi:hypothetical protein
MRPPISGVVATGDGSTLRAVVGLRANSLLTGGIELGPGRASVAPGGSYAVVIRDSRASIAMLPPADTREIELPGETDAASVVFSPGGRAAVVQHTASSDVTIWTGLPDAPRVSGRVVVPDGAVSVAVSDDAAAMVAWNGDGTAFGIGAGTDPQPLGYAVWAVSFVPGTRQMLVIDRSSRVLVLSEPGANDVRIIGQASDALTAAPAMAVSLDGQSALISGSSQVFSIGIAASEMISQPWTRSVAGIAPLGRNAFTISSADAEGVWYAEAGRAPIYLPVVTE